MARSRTTDQGGRLQLLTAAGIHELLRAHTLAASHGVPFTMTGTHGVVAQVLHITATYDLLTHPDDRPRRI